MDAWQDTKQALRPAQALAILWSEAWKTGETEVPAGQFAIVPIGVVDFFEHERQGRPW
jgi:hypothetical protein